HPGTAGGDDPPRRLDAVEHRHPHVHQHDVGTQLFGQPHGLLAVRRFAGDLQIARRAEHHAEADTHQFLVVDEQHPDHASNPREPELTGSAARTRQPPPGAGPASRTPPCTFARSRMPIRPLPAACAISPVLATDVCAVVASTGWARPAPSSSTAMRTDARAAPSLPPSSPAPSPPPSATRRTRTWARVPGPACLRLLVSDSCTIRYTPRATPAGRSSSGPSVSSRTARPAARIRSARSPRSAAVGCGVRAFSPWSSRSIASSLASSASALPPVAET